MTINELINFLIGWGPTILFLLIVLIATLSGIIKGVRKEAISITHSLICFTICLIIFLLLVENKTVDGMFLVAINKILGGEGSLQNMLGVSTKLKTIREVLVAYIPTTLNLVDGLELILKDNGAYLYTLVDMVYRVSFAIILYVLFLILKLICYIIYQIAYPERRHIKRVEKDFEEGELDSGYVKHSGFGALIGATRGLVFGLVTMSFIGTIFFIAAGGDGTRRQEDVDYGDPTLNLVGDAYGSITEYGKTGIFKVFNQLKDKNDVPYYLFAADLIFSGGLKDDNLGINQNIVLRDELAAYVHFARSTYSLLLKYGGEDLKNIIKNDENAKDPMEVFMAIMSDKGFQDDFDDFIIEFDSKTYFVNLSLSLINSIAANIDELNLGVDNEAGEIIKICFKKGHLSEAIPDEAKLLNEKLSDPNYQKHPEKYELDYIRPSYLLGGDDFKLVLRGFFDFINKTNEEVANEEKMTLDLTSAVIDKVRYLSIFETNKKDNLNPVIKRLYKYLDVTYLEVDDNKDMVNKLDSFDELDNIDWMGELLSLVDTVKVAIDTFAYDFINLEPDTDYFKLFLMEFKSNTEGYRENIKGLEEISNFIASSKILGQVLSSSLMYNMILENLQGINDNIILLNNISYANEYDKNGNLVEYGELYYLTNSLVIIAKEEKMLDEVISLIYDLKSDEEINESVLNLVDMLNKETPRGSIVDSLGSSSLGQSILSSFIYSDVFGNEINLESYIDKSLLELDSEDKPINLIKKDEIKGLLRLVPSVLPIINEFMNKMDVTVDDVLDLLADERIEALFDSKLLESIVSGAAFENLANIDDIAIVVPKNAKLISDSEGKSELRTIYDILNENIIDLNLILEGAEPSDYINLLTGLSDSDIDTILSSNIIYYTINNVIISSTDLGINIVIPNTAKLSVENDVIDVLIKKDDFKLAIKTLPDIIPEDINNVDAGELLTNIIYARDGIVDSDILIATIASYIVTSVDTTIINIPTDLDKNHAGKKENLEQSFNDNPWRNEVNSFILALDEILDVTNGGIIDLNNIQSDIMNQVGNLNDQARLDNDRTKLDLLYDSKIISSTLSMQIDTNLKDVITTDNLKDADGHIKEVELETLVHMVDIFNIDLNSLMNDPSYDIVTLIVDNINILNDPYAKDHTITNLDYMYHANLLATLLYDVMTADGSSLRVPNDALIDGNELIKKSEAKALISLKNVFGSLTEISLTNVKINELDNELLSNSVIFSANIYSQLNGRNNIVIPAAVTKGEVDNQYIDRNELNTFMSLLKDSDICNMLFTANTDGSFDLTEIKEIDLVKLKTATIRKLIESTILEGTCVFLLGNSIDKTVFKLPQTYSDGLTKDDLANNQNNPWIKNDEMGKLINALDAIMATSGTNNKDNKIASLQDLTDVNKVLAYIDDGALSPYNNQLSIEVAYESILISSPVSSMLDDTFINNNLVSDDILSNALVIKNPLMIEIYQKNEIVNLLRAFKALGINVNKIQTDGINIDGLLNADYNVVNSSYLVSSILTNEIDKAIKNLAYVDDLNYSNAKVNNYNIRRYTSTELNAFKNSLALLNIETLDNLSFNANKLLEKDENGNFSIIEGLYEKNSLIFINIITRQLDNALGSIINNSLLSKENSNIKEYSDKIYRYKKSEIIGLASTLTDEGLGLGSITDITFNKDTELSPTMISTIYGYNSYLIRYVIANVLDTALTKDIIDQRVLNDSSVKSIDKTYYEEEELTNLISVLNGLGIKTMNGLNSINVSLDTLNDNLYNSSLIGKGILTTQVNNILASMNIQTHNLAYDNNGLYLKWSEIAAIKTICGNSEKFDINNLKLEDLKNSLFNLDGSYKSYLLATTLTSSLKGVLVIPKTCYEVSIEKTTNRAGTIKAPDMLALLDCLDLSITIKNFTIDSLKLVSAEKIYNSKILNATIFKNLNIKNDLNEEFSLYVEKKNVEYLGKDINEGQIYGFSLSELQGLVALLGEGNSIANISLNIDSLLIMNPIEIKKSSLIYIIISDYLMNTVNGYIDTLPEIIRPDKLLGVKTEVMNLDINYYETKYILSDDEFNTALEIIKKMK